MLYFKQLCIIGVTLLIIVGVLQFIVNKNPTTYSQNVSEELPHANIMQMKQSRVKSDFERLQEKYKNETCQLRKLTRPKPSDKRTGLLSYPASGNTWTRHLIQQSTGFKTCVSRSSAACIVYKSHMSSRSAMSDINKAVIIIRNPMYTLKSYFHFKYGDEENKKLSQRTKEERHKNYADVSLFKSPKWTSHVSKGILQWKNSYISWFKIFKRNSLVIVYENLKQNVLQELSKMIKFLKIKVTPKDLWCTLVNKEGDYHRIPRNKTEISVFNLFTEKQKKEILKAVCEVSNVARSMDVDMDISQYLPTLSDIPNTTCS